MHTVVVVVVLVAIDNVCQIGMPESSHERRKSSMIAPCYFTIRTTCSMYDQSKSDLRIEKSLQCKAALMHVLR